MTAALPPCLRPLLNEEIGALQALLETLRDESRALLNHQPHRLEEVVQAKQRLLQHLQTLEQEREGLFQLLGLSPDRSADPFFEQQPDVSLLHLWRRVVELGRECRDWNRRVGATVELARDHLEQALCILQDRPPESSSGYDPRGRKAGRSGSRLLGQA